MKGNSAWACLLLCWLPLGAAGQIQFQQFQQFQPGQTLLQFGTQAAKPERMPESTSDVLAFVDGSALHGQLARMDVEDGLTWAQPEARNPIHFRPAHIDFIRFAHAQSVSMTPTCHLWFANGDDLYGSITSLDNERLGLSTWFGGAMVIPRAAVRAITLLSAHYSVVYEGPYDPGGWVVVNNTPKSWTFHDGAFVGTGPGTLGRELNLTNSTTVEFDLAWTGVFALEAGIYCDPMGRLEVNGGSCVVNLTPRQISLNQVRNMGIPFNLAGNLAGAPVPGGEGQSRMHVAIECDKAEGTVSVFINHLLAKTWKDSSFGGGSGTGVVFTQRYMLSSATLKLSHLKISQWEGRCEPETAALATHTDAIHFINHDRAAGKIESIQDGKARLALGATVLDIPLQRVTQIEFAAAKASTEPPSPWQVRAHFPGGGSLSFQLEKWDDKTVSGQSATFGALAFQPGAIREMEFNLNRSKEDGVAADNKEFEELDE
jgi:hypothetical protein